MLDKIGDMENDPTSSKNRNTLEPPSEEEINNALEEVEEEEEEDYAGDDIFEDGELLVGNQGEFSALNRQLDQLQSALDEIESRNSDIHKELLEILHSNREVRKNLREEVSSAEEGSSSPSEQNNVPAGGVGILETIKTSKEGVATGGGGSNVDGEVTDLLVNANTVGQLLQALTKDIDRL